MSTFIVSRLVCLWVCNSVLRQKWIKEAIHIRKEGQRAMNREEGGYIYQLKNFNIRPKESIGCKKTPFNPVQW